MEEKEIVGLREALQNQSATLSRLYAELEEERRAAASGAQEALAMIARLQGERAAAKMEASHYRRIAEEKLQHADESLSILKEFMFQKEMEIVSLKYHLQNYKQMLSVMRIDDHQFFGRGCTFSRKESLARHISLPANNALEELSSLVSDEISVSDHNLQQFIEDYELTRLHDFIQFTRPAKGDVKKRYTKWSPVRRKLREKKLRSHDDFHLTSTIIPVKIHDMPGCSWWIDDTVKLNEERVISTRSEVCCLTLHENRHGCSHCGSGNHFKSNCMNKKLSSSEEEDMDYLQDEDKLSKASGKAPIISHPSPSDSEHEITTSQTNIKQLKNQIQQLEDDMRRMKQEDLERGREQTQLLGRMMDHLGAAKPQLPHTGNNTDIKRHQENDILLTYLQEAMLHFWI